MRGAHFTHFQHGVSMIEVLVTIVILVFGLLGLVGLQARLQLSEMESYQRSQAIILLDDYAHRIAANRSGAASYVTGSTSPLGTGMNCPASTGTTAERDAADWCHALQGASETQPGSVKVGAFIGGRGCVEDLGSGEYMITVSWQGMNPVSAPPASVSCGKNNYDGGTGSSCANDLCRRTLTTIVRFATL